MCYQIVKLLFQQKEVKVQWAGKEGLTVIEQAELTNGTIETNKTSNTIGYSLCKFTLDSNINVQHGMM
jgi:hypothetical protein